MLVKMLTLMFMLMLEDADACEDADAGEGILYNVLCII